MKQFFPMSKSEASMLAFLIVMSVILFLPMWRTIEIGGMVVFGWLLAALMVISPVLALLVLRRSDRAERGKNRQDTTEFEGTENESHPLGSEGDPKD